MTTALAATLEVTPPLPTTGVTYDTTSSVTGRLAKLSDALNSYTTRASKSREFSFRRECILPTSCARAFVIERPDRGPMLDWQLLVRYALRATQGER